MAYLDKNGLSRFFSNLSGLFVSAKPQTFTDAQKAQIRENIGSGVADAKWGQITGTLSQQSDLNTALSGKANSSHTHTKSQITDFPSIPTTTSSVTSGSTAALTSGGAYTALEGKANSSHTHTKSQITDFPYIPTNQSIAGMGFPLYNNGSTIATDTPYTKTTNGWLFALKKGDGETSYSLTVEINGRMIFAAEVSNAPIIFPIKKGIRFKIGPSGVSGTFVWYPSSEN